MTDTDTAWERVLDELCTYGFNVYGGKVALASREAWEPVESAIHTLLNLQAEAQEAS